MTLRKVRNHPKNTREEVVNDLKVAVATVTKKTIGNTLNPADLARSLCSRRHMNDSESGWEKVLWSDYTKLSSLALTQPAVFGGTKMQPMTPKTLSSMELETFCFGDVFLLKLQDNFTASTGEWMEPRIVKS